MLRIEICVFFLFHSLWFELHLLARRADVNENREEQNGRAKSWEGREGGGAEAHSGFRSARRAKQWTKRKRDQS